MLYRTDRLRHCWLLYYLSDALFLSISIPISHCKHVNVKGIIEPAQDALTNSIHNFRHNELSVFPLRLPLDCIHSTLLCCYNYCGHCHFDTTPSAVWWLWRSLAHSGKLYVIGYFCPTKPSANRRIHAFMRRYTQIAQHINVWHTTFLIQRASGVLIRVAYARLCGHYTRGICPYTHTKTHTRPSTRTHGLTWANTEKSLPLCAFRHSLRARSHSLSTPPTLNIGKQKSITNTHKYTRIQTNKSVGQLDYFAFSSLRSSLRSVRNTTASIYYTLYIVLVCFMLLHKLFAIFRDI